MPAPEPYVTITPLGGLGEIGLNCLLVETAQDLIVIDCGLMFPDDCLLGIDVVIPRFNYLLARKDKLRGIILTHGHEDHIGALPWLLPHVDTPLYSSRFTLALVENKLKAHNLKRNTELVPVEPHWRLSLGDLAVTFFPVCHSIIQGYGLGIETPIGRIVHTGDFKIDPQPLDDNVTDLNAFCRFANEGNGTLLLLSDSTNVELEGHALTERETMASLAEIFRQAHGRIIITLFSSHIQRMQGVFNLAWQTGRKVAANGRSILTNIEIARDLKFLRIPTDTYVDLKDLVELPDKEVVVLVTGSQGEPLSALTRIAMEEHRKLSIHPGDTVILSSRFIPGNVRAITKMINRLYKLGAEVLYEKVQAIHASGHAYKEELRLILTTVKPKFFVPIHGEYRHLAKHCRLARECGVAPERAIVLEDGSPLTFLPQGIHFEKSVPVEHIYVDGKGVGDVGQTVLKERQLLGGEGLVVALLVVNKQTWEILVGPDILSKGFLFEPEASHFLEDVKCIILEIFENVPPKEYSKLKNRIRSSLRRFFRMVLERDPVVLPLIVYL
ncbi:Ribonuclease J1 [Desulfovibrionales bacterium]